MIKAIFFDVDGTLLSHQYGNVSSNVKTALMQLKQKGMKLFAATGRHRLELEALPVNDLPFDGYVTLNGQICLDARQRVLYDSPIAAADTKTVISYFKQNKIPIMIIELNDMYINFVNSAVCTAQKAISTPVPPCGIYSGNEVYQFIVFDHRSQVQALVEPLTSCKMSEWNCFAFDIIPRQGGKVSGIQKILKHYHINQNEIMAFGDGENDMDMLEYAGIGVAMGNADKKVQDQADYVTADVDHDGVVQALRYFKLI